MPGGLSGETAKDSGVSHGRAIAVSINGFRRDQPQDSGSHQRHQYALQRYRPGIFLREGLPPDRVIKTGSPMYEVLHYYMPKIQRSEIRSQLKLQEKDYFVMSCHREENVDDEANFRGLVEVLTGLAEAYGKRIIGDHPSPYQKTYRRASAKLPPLVELHKPFGLLDYVNLQMNACAVLSDSGTINEESSILNFPALNIRQAHERPEGRGRRGV